jgi:hypothetical protein
VCTSFSVRRDKKVVGVFVIFVRRFSGRAFENPALRKQQYAARQCEGRRYRRHSGRTFVDALQNSKNDIATLIKLLIDAAADGAPLPGCRCEEGVTAAFGLVYQ